MKQPISKLLVNEAATEKELSGYSNCEIKDLLLGKEITAQTELGKALIENKSSGGSSEGDSEPFDINNIIFPSLNSVISRASNHAKFGKMSMNLDPVYSSDYKQWFYIPNSPSCRGEMMNIHPSLSASNTREKVLALHRLLAFCVASIYSKQEDGTYDSDIYNEKYDEIRAKFYYSDGYLEKATTAHIVLQILNEQHKFYKETNERFAVVFDEELPEFIKMFYEDE